ncbi:MAG: RNA polymerase sigma factor [Planctomycetota bacterium]|nr:RNA polymerase sigma factor [Planctomycetota bacterium]
MEAVPEESVDSQLMERVNRGDMAAFEEIVRRHQSALVNFFRRSNASMEEAEECAQETFVRMYNYRSRYRALPGRFAAFMYVVARHVWVDRCRRSQRLRRLTTQLAIDSAPPKRPASGLTQAETRIDAQKALDVLSDKLREVVVLSVFQGLDYSQIAEVLGIPLGTVKSRIFLAFQQMRSVLSHDQQVRTD